MVAHFPKTFLEKGVTPPRKFPLKNGGALFPEKFFLKMITELLWKSVREKITYIRCNL